MSAGDTERSDSMGGRMQSLSQLSWRTTLTWIVHIGLWAIVMGSIVWVLQSDLHVSRQFLSFAGMFVVLTGVFWPLTKPLRE